MPIDTTRIQQGGGPYGRLQRNHGSHTRRVDLRGPSERAAGKAPGPPRPLRGKWGGIPRTGCPAARTAPPLSRPRGPAPAPESCERVVQWKPCMTTFLKPPEGTPKTDLIRQVKYQVLGNFFHEGTVEGKFAVATPRVSRNENLLMGAQLSNESSQGMPHLHRLPAL